MRNINIAFDDEDFEYIKEVKNGTPWHKFILECARTIKGNTEEEEE